MCARTVVVSLVVPMALFSPERVQTFELRFTESIFLRQNDLGNLLIDETKAKSEEKIAPTGVEAKLMEPYKA